MTRWFIHGIDDSRWAWSPYIGRCSICQNPIDSPCVDHSLEPKRWRCAALDFKALKHYDMLITMLLVRKRLFPALPRDIVRRILNYAWRENKRSHKLKCKWSLVPTCGHTFHAHCLDKWVRSRRECMCPLDNGLFDHVTVIAVTEAVWCKSYVEITKVW